MTNQILGNHVDRAQKFLDISRKRSLFFPNDIVFENSAWELLLEVYILTAQERCVSKEQLSQRLSIQPSIVARWINIFMEREYLVLCEKNGKTYLQLTESAHAGCLAYLDAIADI